MTRMKEWGLTNEMLLFDIRTNSFTLLKYYFCCSVLLLLLCYQHIGMANWKRYINQLIYRCINIDMSDISREIYRYIQYIKRSISIDYLFLNKHPLAKMLRMGENWESGACHLGSHRIDIFYLLDGLSKLTRIITYFQTHEHEKLITTFFTRYFPSLSVCHKNWRVCWKLLWTIIYPIELEKLIITCFHKKKKKKNEKTWISYNRDISKNISIDTDI